MDSQQKAWTIDIVIAQYKNTSMLTRCLESLKCIKLPDNLNKIFVIENGGKFGAEKITVSNQSALPLCYLYLDIGNLSKARNLAVENSNADIILFFDNDLTFTNDTLTSYIDTMSKYVFTDNIGFFGGPLMPCYEKCPKDYLLPFLPKSAIGFSLGKNSKVIDQPEFLGGNHALKRNVLVAMGGYDLGSADGENAGLVGEETRLMKKCIDNGYLGAYSADALVYHYVPKSQCNARWVLKRTYRHGLTDSLTEEKYINSSKRLFSIPLYLYRIWIISLLKVVVPTKGHIFKRINKVAYITGVMSGKKQLNTKY